MSSRRTTSSLTRLALVVVPLGLFVVPLATPAQADPGTSSELRSSRQPVGAAATTDAVARELARAEEAFRAAKDRVSLLSRHGVALEVRAEQAAAEAARLYELVEDQDGVASAVSNFLGGGDSELALAMDAADNAEHASELASDAAAALADAIEERERAQAVWAKQRLLAKRLGVKQQARLAARAAARQSRFSTSYSVDDPAQDARNQKALGRWLGYLDSLADAAILPASAQRLEAGEDLPEGLDPVRAESGRVVPGVAEMDPAGAPAVVILPAETIRAVSEAFSLVGDPDAAGAADAPAYACGGLVSQSWSPTSVSVPADSMAQWRELRPVPLSQVQVGDVLVLGTDASGLTGSGLYVGAGTIITVDAAEGQALVRRLHKDQVYGIRRPALANGVPRAAPDAANCGLLDEIGHDEPTTGAGPLLVPVPEGSYTPSADFGDGGSLWSSGQHSGQDFAAPLGTPVYAAASGTVTIEEVDWAGTLVRIDHGAGVETWYGHMSQVTVSHGDALAAGELIGAVGSEGNSTGPHLHLEVRLDGEAIDPMAVLDPTSFAVAGVFANGEIPQSSLCAATAGGVQSLRCDAAVAYRMMSVAYQAALGTELCITDSYRTRESQEQLFRTKPALAAVPGTSEHGWGVAVDLCGGVESFGTSRHEWLASNAPTYGWVHPEWAAEGGSKPEPWHFEYVG